MDISLHTTSTVSRNTTKRLAKHWLFEGRARQFRFFVLIYFVFWQFEVSLSLVLQQQILNMSWGSFNNYVDKILPNFDPTPSSSGQKLMFYTLCIYPLSRDPSWTFHWPSTPLLINLFSTKLLNDPWSNITRQAKYEKSSLPKRTFEPFINLKKL